MAAQRELPPRRQLPAQPVVAARPTRPGVAPAKPDARPMRIVYGAGAVAAMSVMAVGLVQPDFGAASPLAPADQAVQVRHVVRYIQLQPGQKAPPGATVIAATGSGQRARPQANNVLQARPAAQPAPPQPQPKPRVKTRQSGKP